MDFDSYCSSEISIFPQMSGWEISISSEVGLKVVLSRVHCCIFLLLCIFFIVVIHGLGISVSLSLMMLSGEVEFGWLPLFFRSTSVNLDR